MGFILDGLETESYDRQYNDRDLLNRIASYSLFATALALQKSKNSNYVKSIKSFRVCLPSSQKTY